MSYGFGFCTWDLGRWKQRSRVCSASTYAGCSLRHGVGWAMSGPKPGAFRFQPIQRYPKLPEPYCQCCSSSLLGVIWCRMLQNLPAFDLNSTCSRGEIEEVFYFPRCLSFSKINDGINTVYLNSHLLSASYAASCRRWDWKQLIVAPSQLAVREAASRALLLMKWVVSLMCIDQHWHVFLGLLVQTGFWARKQAVRIVFASWACEDLLLGLK